MIMSTPQWIQKPGKLAVRLDADMGEKNDHVRLSGAIVVADDADFFRGFNGVDKGPDDLLVFCGCDHFFCQDPDKHDLHPVYVQCQVGLEQTGVVQSDEEVRIDDRETGAFLQEQKMRDAVVYFMISHCRDIRRQRVHEVDG